MAEIEERKGVVVEVDLTEDDDWLPSRQKDQQPADAEDPGEQDPN